MYFSATTLLLGLCSQQSLAALVQTGLTVIVDDIWYYAPPKIATLPTSSMSSSLFTASNTIIPITIMTSGLSALSTSSIASIYANYTSVDDVWQPAFGATLFALSSSSSTAMTMNVTGNTTVVSMSSNSSMSIPSGPYFLSSSGNLYRAHRLYPDLEGAFTESVSANADGTYSVLPAGAPGQSIAIAVPSRLYYTRTATKPLAGVRLGVKDIYDVAGLRTSNGNRAWYHLYSAANTTATPVQRLIDAGAIIIGKMKTSQFANGESPTADWVDYHAPFNPRGDGYQNPSSSSSGPGAGAGAYPWLDLTLGSDTGGSIRNPAQVQGVYGNRPTYNLVPLAHTMPLAPELDTAGFLTRDPELWATASGVMYQNNITFSSSYPKQILTIGFPTNVSAPGDADLINFLRQITALTSANVSTFNITTAWATTSNTSVALTDLLNLTYTTLITKEQTALVRQPFYADYAKAHQGRLPAVDPVPLVRWAFADSNVTTLSQAVANKTTFQTWFNSKVLIANNQTCSDKLLLYVGTQATANYRNRYLSSPSPPFGYSIGQMSIMSGAPDMVVPVGQGTYNSTITNHTEYLPVAVDILAARGCDGMIFNLVRDLVKMKALNVSLAGMSGIDGGQTLYKRALSDLPSWH